MSRRRKQPEHENHERWLVSYADFITLLFAFFVVLFASGQTDKTRAHQMSESVKDAIEGDSLRMKAAISKILGANLGSAGEKPAAAKATGEVVSAGGHRTDLDLLLTRLKTDLKSEIEAGQMQVRREPRGLLITLRQATFFPSGEDTIAPETYASLGKLSAAIRPLPNPIRLEGHTDALPIRTPRFQSNWELSAARSIAVLNILSQRFEVPTSRMAVIGYAETAPVADNDTAEGRGRNRRVDIVLLNDQAQEVEPRGAQHH